MVGSNPIIKLVGSKPIEPPCPKYCGALGSSLLLNVSTMPPSYHWPGLIGTACKPVKWTSRENCELLSVHGLRLVRGRSAYAEREEISEAGRRGSRPTVVGPRLRLRAAADDDWARILNVVHTLGLPLLKQSGEALQTIRRCETRNQR